MARAERIWVDGELVRWDDARDHMLAHSLHYGLGAFEGIRAYEQPSGRAAVFRLDEHIGRLFDTCHICMIDVPFTRDQLAQACLETLRANGLREAYLRPIVYVGPGELGLGAQDNPIRTLIASFPWGAYLGEEGLRRGIRAKVSSYRRGGVDAIMTKGKITGQYTTSILAKRDAHKTGHDEAIMLDAHGLVAEGTGENIFLVKGGALRTPPTSGSILAGITRDSVIHLARELEIEVVEQPFTRDELWTADEIFLTGTAAEVTPVREIDDRTIGAGEPGPVTRALQDRFFRVVRSGEGLREDWLTPV